MDKASVPVPGTVCLLLQLAVFGAATAALARLRHWIPAGVIGLVAVANAALMVAWRR